MAGEMLRVLVVDDNDLVRDMCVTVLQHHGHLTLEAGSADEALHRLGAGEQVHVVLTDLTMPGSVDGRGLVTRLLDERPDVGIVVATGDATVTAASLGEDADRVEVVHKPFGMEALVGAVVRAAAATS